MQFTIHLDGTESPAQLRRVSEAVLALGGDSAGGSVGTLHLRMDASKIKETLDEVVSNLKADCAVEQGKRVAAGEAGLKMADAEPAGTPKLAMRVKSEGQFGAEDDPAAILAAARGGDTPLAPGSTGAPSTAGAESSATAPAANAGSSPAPMIELDSAGLPWDERIHSGSRAKIKDGTWRKRSKLPDGVFEAIEAELRLQYPKPAPPLPPEPTTEGGGAFAELVNKLHAAYSRAENPVTKARQQEVMAELGLTGLEQLNKRPDLFDIFSAKLGL